MKFKTDDYFFVVLSGRPNLFGTNELLEDFKPSTLNQPGQEYPQVNSQGYARFKINAPQADSVRVSLGLGGRGGTLLTKGADGFFTAPQKGQWMKAFIIII